SALMTSFVPTHSCQKTNLSIHPIAQALRPQRTDQRPLRSCLLLFALASLVISAPAQVRSRIAASIDDNRMPMRGNIHPLGRKASDSGQVAASLPMQRITLLFNRTAEQQADLHALLRDQQDRSSSSFHRWLTPEQYATRFGLSEGDLSKVTGWLEKQGFEVVEKARSRTYVAFSGT